MGISINLASLPGYLKKTNKQNNQNQTSYLPIRQEYIGVFGLVFCFKAMLKVSTKLWISGFGVAFFKFSISRYPRLVSNRENSMLLDTMDLF